MTFDKILRYCADLEKNNNRPWFHENHAQYEEAKVEFEELVELVKFCIVDRVPELSEELIFEKPKNMIYRIPRDARMHRNLPPYNPSFRAYVSRDKKSWLPIGYYFKICPGESVFGTGYFAESTEKLNAVRSYILDNAEEFLRIVNDNNLTIVGTKLKRVPQGYPDGLEISEYLKHKDWEAMVQLEDSQLTTFDDFIKLAGDIIDRMEPFRKFMLEAATSLAPNEWEMFR